MERSKCCVGVDISKDDFTACFAFGEETAKYSFSSVEKFPNEKRGFNRLMRRVRKQASTHHELTFLMEATGVYHESPAYHLHGLKQRVCVVLPNSIKHYGISLGISSKTDPIDARLPARPGVEREHRLWTPPGKDLRKLRQLTRYVGQLKDQRTAIENLRHSQESEYETAALVARSMKKVLKPINQAIDDTRQEIEQLIAQTPPLSEKLKYVLSIPGVGLHSAAVIIAETQGFEHIRSIKQLTGYAGYDVVMRESGSSVKAKTHISKKGNSYLRAALFYPAMVATRFNPEMKRFYLRINGRNTSKMVGQVAVQRKLLALIYTLWKNEVVYDPDRYKKTAPTKTAEAALDRQ